VKLNRGFRGLHGCNGWFLASDTDALQFDARFSAPGEKDRVLSIRVISTIRG